MTTKKSNAIATELAALMGEPPPKPVEQFVDARAKLVALMAELSPRHQKFVACVLSGKDGKASATAAGFNPNGAAVRAHRLIHENPRVAAVINLAKKEMAEVNSFNVERAMVELDDAIAFAKESKQANALVKAIELRARLHGLLIDKQEILLDAKPSIKEAMDLARARTGMVPLGQTIDGEFRTIESGGAP